MDTIERINGYHSNGMGDHGPHAIRRAPDGSIMFLIGNNTYVGTRTRRRGQRRGGRHRELAELAQRRGAAVPAAVQRSALRQQHPHRRALDGVAAAAEQQFSLFFSGMRNPYDFAFNLAGEAFTFDSDMEWDVNAPWYREVRTVHMIPGRRRRLPQRHGQVPGRVLRHDPGAAAPAPRIAGRRRGLSELRLSGEVLRQPVRGRLVARSAALHRAHGQRRHLHGREDLAEFVHGEPMPITDLEVGPDGNIYLTTGGGRGQGGLYKVSWTGRSRRSRT